MRPATHDVPQLDATTQQLLQMLQQQINLNQPQYRTTTSRTASAKLLKYTITHFKGEYTYWLRFWGQFSVEIDENEQLADISKFNYLMEYVKGEAKEAITGLPYTPEGYEEAKAILKREYGRGSKVKRAVLKELEEISPISYSTSNRLEKYHQFYNKLSKTVHTLMTLRALESSEN